MKIFAILISFLILTSQSSTIKKNDNWNISVQEKITFREAGKGEYRKVNFQSRTKVVLDFFAHVVLLQPNSYRVELIDNPSNKLNNYRTVAKLTEETGAITGINGGFFTKDFMPNGLFILKGKIVSPIKKLKSPVLAGLLLIDESGRTT